MNAMPYHTQKREQGVNLIVFKDFPGLLSRFQFSFLMLDPFDLTEKKGVCDLGTSQAGNFVLYLSLTGCN